MEMENTELLRKREAKRLVDWIKLHRNEWECLCHSMAEDEWELDTEEAVHLLTEFRNGGFYQILIILLSVLHINHWEAREEINFTLFEKLSDVWDEHKVGEITDKIIRSLTAGKEA